MMKAYVAAALALVTGCVADETDAIDAPFLVDGKSDTSGIVEGSPEALAVLRLANDSTESKLRTQVGLAATTAAAITAYKLGDDEAAGTNDDARFDTLAELDAVPYVGPVAFDALLSYAQQNGLVPSGPSAKSWHITTVTNGLYPRYAVSPQGDLAIVTESVHPVIQLGSTIVPMPPNPDTGNTAFLVALAFDRDSALHVITGGGAPNYSHFRWSNASWTLIDSFPKGDKIELRQSPDGDMFALASKVAGTRSYLSLVSLHANAPSTVEPMWDLYQYEDRGFSVGPDGYPVLAWGANLDYARRGPQGWRKTALGAQDLASDMLPTGGVPGTMIFKRDTTTHFVQQDANGIWGAQTSTALGHVQAITVDGEGTIHTCGGDRHGQLANGTLTVGSLGSDTEDCWLATDASGKVHIAYRMGSVINAGTYE